MRGVLILGSGRSGTSMFAGMLRNAGFFMGDNYLQPREANPKGYFEDSEVNCINDEIIAATLRSRWRRWNPFRMQRKLPKGAHWLAELSPNSKLRVSKEHEFRIRARIPTESFAYKDPRFCYTYPAWRKHLPTSTRIVVVFRNPQRTIESILREAREDKVLAQSIRLTPAHARRVWVAMYSNVLSLFPPGEAFFVSYEDVLSGKSLPSIERYLGVRLDANFPDHSLSRTADVAGSEFTPVNELYQILKNRAEQCCNAWR